MTVILTDEEARIRAERLRRDHDQLEKLLDRAEKYIRQLDQTKSTENLSMPLPTPMSVKLLSDERPIKSPTPSYRSETKSPAPDIRNQIMSPTERMKQITIDTDSDSQSSFSQSIHLSGRDNFQKTPDELATSAQRLSKESAKSTDFSEKTEASEKTASKAVSIASPRSTGSSKKQVSVRIASPASESRATSQRPSSRKSGSKSPSVLKSSTRSSKSSGTKSPKPKPMRQMEVMLIPSDSDSDWSQLAGPSTSKASKARLAAQTRQKPANKSFNSVMNALDDDDSFQFD
ncbi:Oidioi.mRNA.OKI2018_I69.PAR.g10723.t1.cds [Oikopleura dioica]|uniref:Oidioi.mRNA.OKI2018_I69.PAR.g10723.t1.cds n=1 Tax=Oikopleura dioica TaxID=34765 RepID=A0ABN7RXA1_OIKDI|nr:Oidioi.mRNA.OKI2018_I69.PAR.g10723.t1.cds [Oikopleura dioica]